MQRFLIIQTAFTGDVVLATNLIEQLHSNFPDAEIDFLLRRGNESLFTDHPFLHEVLVWDKKEKKYSNLFSLISQIRKRKYDKVINLQRYFSTGLITAFSGAAETIGFNKNPLSFLFTTKIKHITGTSDHPVHETERNLSLIKYFAINGHSKMRLYPSAKHADEVKAFTNVPYICVAPASVWFTKQYPKEKWIAFLTLIPNNIHIYFIGGKDDKNLCDEISSNLPNHQTKNFCGQFGFLASAALMQHAVMNYANDSAPVHIAGAVNASITEIYCSTIPAFGYGPLSDKSFIVEINEQLACRPCGIHGKRECPQKHFNCAFNIKETQLLGTLDLHHE